MHTVDQLNLATAKFGRFHHFEHIGDSKKWRSFLGHSGKTIFQSTP